MTREEFDTLCRDDVRRAVEENLGRDPLAVALDRRTPHAALVALERDPVLAAVAARNLRLLGAANVEVVCASAEEYLAATTERFDWVAADPDRRSRTGRKLVRLEECSPDILRLLPAVRRVRATPCCCRPPAPRSICSATTNSAASCSKNGSANTADPSDDESVRCGKTRRTALTTTEQ